MTIWILLQTGLQRIELLLLRKVLTEAYSSPVSRYYNRTARSLRHVSIRPPTLTVSLGDLTKGWKSPVVLTLSVSEQDILTKTFVYGRYAASYYFNRLIKIY